MTEDRRAIERLLFTYAELMDGGDFEALADLLSGAVLGAQGQTGGFEGRDAILKMFVSTVRIYEDGTPRTKHVTTNVQVEVDPTRATATSRSYFTVLQSTPDFPLQTIIAGRYSDRFERSDGTWRFVERRFATDLIGDMSRHFQSESGRLLGRPESHSNNV